MVMHFFYTGKMAMDLLEIGDYKLEFFY